MRSLLNQLKQKNRPDVHHIYIWPNGRWCKMEEIVVPPCNVTGHHIYGIHEDKLNDFVKGLIDRAMLKQPNSHATPAHTDPVTDADLA